MTLFLCGFMGCGKTELGKTLAQQLQIPFTDMDDAIIAVANKTIPEIFDLDGEEAFRKIETEMIGTLAQKPGIVSCGGGAMVNPMNAVTVHQYQGIVIYLQQTFATCYDRIKDDPNRPIVQSHTREELETLFHERERWYQVNATYSVLAGETPEESAERVLRVLNKWSPQFLQQFSQSEENHETCNEQK